MKRYDCDGGTIMIGNSSFRMCIPNGFGDGCHKVEVYENKKKIPKDYKWKCAIHGNDINVYDYDCLNENQLTDKHVLYKLNGWYSVYADCGNIIIAKQ